MKHLFLFTALLLALSQPLSAQKSVYVDSEYILSNVPEYKAAQKQLEDIAAEWQKEIESKLADINQVYKTYQVEKILLSEEMRIKREEDILKKETDENTNFYLINITKKLDLFKKLKLKKNYYKTSSALCR